MRLTLDTKLQILGCKVRSIEARGTREGFVLHEVWCLTSDGPATFVCPEQDFKAFQASTGRTVECSVTVFDTAQGAVRVRLEYTGSVPLAGVQGGVAK